jgi:hypothetical protein
MGAHGRLPLLKVIVASAFNKRCGSSFGLAFDGSKASIVTVPFF